MSHIIKVKTQPGEALRFPRLCPHCGQMATERTPISRRQGQTTRVIYVPICADCGRELNLKSGEEERWERIGLLATAGGGLLVTVLGVIILPALLPIFALLPFLLQLLFALALGVTVAYGTWRLIKRKSMQEAKPIKLAVLNSARMLRYTWRTTTFEFENNEFAQRFKELNEPDLMQV